MTAYFLVTLPSHPTYKYLSPTLTLHLELVIRMNPLYNST